MPQSRILFVCLGNTCRSPMAEGLFRRIAAERDLIDSVLIDSAGTGRWHVGEPPNGHAIAAMRQRGIDISDCRARQIADEDFTTFDLIIAMDQAIDRLLRHRAPHGTEDRIRMLLDFAPEAPAREIADPYHRGTDAYATTLDLLDRGARGLIAHLS